VPTAPFAAVDDGASLLAGLERIGFPAILKTRRLGYDGKGQALVKDAAEAMTAVRELGGRDLILEGVVDFERELSILAVRSVSGEVRYYPLVENTHCGGILRRSVAPAPDSVLLQEQAEAIALKALNELEYVGVLAIELFQKGDELSVNEMAPRVHNSGHWTIEGAETSQFENHLRAILDLPLGSTSPIGYSVMLNLIGDLPDTQQVLRTEGAHLHLYGKHPRAGRKVGHITIRGGDPTRVMKTAEELRRDLPIVWE